MKRVGVLGWYGHANCGDESYKLAFPKLFPHYDFEFSRVITGDKDAWVLGGGDVVGQHFLAKIGGVQNKHILSATVSEACDLRGFGTVAVRDETSRNLAAQYGAANAVRVPDFAFALRGDQKRGRSIIESAFRATDAELYEKVVVVVVNGYLAGQHDAVAREYITFQNFANSMAVVCDHTCASFLFLPFGVTMPADDRIANGWVSSKCKFWQKNVVMFNPLGVQDTIDVISSANAVVSTRLHSSIFSCACGTPFVDVTHNHKNAGFLETVGLTKCSIDYRSFDTARMLSMLQESLGNEPALRASLSETAERQRKLLYGFAKNVDLIQQ
jgi:polysaccharide pyruvyl transferase WcaK-like protein